MLNTIINNKTYIKPEANFQYKNNIWYRFQWIPQWEFALEPIYKPLLECISLVHS